MKQPKKPTREQKIVISNNGLVVGNWMVVEETEFYLKVIHKTSGKMRRLDRYSIKKR